MTRIGSLLAGEPFAVISPGGGFAYEAFTAEGKAVDRAVLDSVPGRKAPGDPVPIFNMTPKASRIAYIQFSGPSEGQYLAADEIPLLL